MNESNETIGIILIKAEGTISWNVCVTYFITQNIINAESVFEVVFTPIVMRLVQNITLKTFLK